MYISKALQDALTNAIKTLRDHEMSTKAELRNIAELSPTVEAVVLEQCDLMLQDASIIEAWLERRLEDEE